MRIILLYKENINFTPLELFAKERKAERSWNLVQSNETLKRVWWY